MPSDTIPDPLLTPPCSVSGDSIALPLLNVNHSLSLPETLTACIHFHIPDTSIELNFTAFGRPLIYRTVLETLELATDEITTNVILHPVESIMDGFFRQRHEGLEIRIYEYVGKQVTWFLLNQVFWGIEYFALQVRRLREMRFEIEVEDKGRVGHGSLWDTDLEDKDDAKRAVNRTSQHLPMTSISKPALTNPNPSLLSPIPNESNLIVSYHFFGPTLPEPAISTCLRSARQSIRTNVQHHPHDDLPDGFFQYRADDSDLSIGVKAYADNQISWLLLEHILRVISDDLIGEHHLWACEFEFEIYPFEEPYGHGALDHDPDAPSSPPNPTTS